MFSMCDPFFALILKTGLGADYIVWDKASSISFRKPGLGVLRATFTVSRAQLLALKQQVDEEGKAEPEFTAEIKNSHDVVVATVAKTLSIKKANKEHLGRSKHRHSQV
jgi:hypothetical protein